MPKNELFIHSIQMVEVDGATNIPTAVSYNSTGEPVIGHSAFAESGEDAVVNEDFKIDLGRFAPGAQIKRLYDTATGQRKSALQIADAFLYEVQKLIKAWLASRGLVECKNLVVAEPLSMHTEEVSPEWLANYRSSVRRMLE